MFYGLFNGVSRIFFRGTKEEFKVGGEKSAEKK